MKTLTGMFLTLALTLTAAASAQAGSRYEVDAARRASNNAQYQVQNARRAVGNLSRQMGRKWSRVTREAMHKNPGRTYAAKQTFRHEMSLVLQAHNNTIYKAQQTINAYRNQYAAEARWITNRGTLANLRARRDQNIQIMQRTINGVRGQMQHFRNYWNSHLVRVY